MKKCIMILFFAFIFTAISYSGGFKRVKVIDTSPKPPEIKKNSRFGINGTTPKHFKLVSELGDVISGLTDFSWNMGEPEKPVKNVHKYAFYSSKKVKKLFEQLKNTGRKLHINVRVYNKWALEFDPSMIVEDPINGLKKEAILRIKPVYLNSWKKFITHIIENYPVSSIQIGNESENEWFSIEGYLEALKVAYVTVKKIKPEVIVCAGGFNFGEYCMFKGERQRKALNNMFFQHKIAFVRKFIEFGKDYYDVLTMHANRDYSAIEPTVRWFREEMKKNGVKKSIWFDDMSSATFLGGYFAAEKDNHLLSRIKRNDISAVKRYRAMQSSLLIKKCVTAFAAGVQNIFISSDTDDSDHYLICWRHLGLMTNIGKPKPAYFTLKMFIEKIDGFSRVKRIQNYQMKMKKNEPFVFRIERFDKKPLYIAWSKSKEKSVNLSVYSKSELILITPIVTRLDRKGKPVYGVPIKVDAKQVKLGREPVFFELN